MNPMINRKAIATSVLSFIKAAELNTIAKEYQSDDRSFLEAITASIPETNDDRTIKVVRSFWIFFSLMSKVPTACIVDSTVEVTGV